ncbi:ATP-binding protein [Amycolatopsis sp. CA-230715]|uniref:ATP-binding protein n=1 Tax=Amycolatopsis sp. CA-230715 TaxID=2745196 RepID=UPI001C017275|nr:helix-turn-helix domain-containing protein [Amycolatopsis sp. CA-230715]QWF83006.1 Regulatory protein AfsR [Amycolatopsis sp. CA-230715]
MSERATFGAELRRHRVAAGLSLTWLAERTHYSKGYLSKVETGLATPNAALAALCETELGIPGALIGFLPSGPKRRRTRPDTRPSGLPPLATDFTGRSTELRRVRDALRTDSGLCVVSGMGGVGKTELAVRCAHRLEAEFSDGCLFVDLRGYDPEEPTASPDAVHDRLLRVLGVPAALIPADPDDRTALYRSRLHGRSMLLVLDNAVSAAQVRPLLPGEPKCRVLITSRSRLPAIDDACHVSLDVLPAPAAVELFSALTGLPPEDDVARVVECCGRLPLAIRIAAARLRAHPAWNLGELDRRLHAEATRLDELDDGERTLSAVFRLSVRQLTTAESQLFRLLALHPGDDFDVHTASAVSGLSLRETDRALERLHDTYLLVQPDVARYRFHDLLRTFAREDLLNGSAEQDRTRAFRRLAGYAVRNTANADRLLTPQRFQPAIEFEPDLPERVRLDDDEMALTWFQAEWPNLVALCRAANKRGEHDRCWQLAYFLRGFFFTSKLWDAWIATNRWARESAAALDNRWALATVTANLGVAMVDQGKLDEATVYYREALGLYRDLGDGHGESTMLAHRAWVAHYRGHHDDALHDLRLARVCYERTGNRRNAAITNRGIALVMTALGQAVEAATVAIDILPIFDELGLPLDAAMTQNCLGWAWFHTERDDLATAAYQDAVTRAVSCGSDYETARAYTGLGNLAAARGEREVAAEFWARADEAHPGLDPVIVGENRARRSLAGATPQSGGSGSSPAQETRTWTVE